MPRASGPTGPKHPEWRKVPKRNAIVSAPRFPGRSGFPREAIFKVESEALTPAMIQTARMTMDSVVIKAREKLNSNPLVSGEDKMRAFADVWNMLFDMKNGFGFGLEQTALVSIGLMRKKLDAFSIAMVYMALANELGLPMHLVPLPGTVMVRWQDPKACFNFFMGQYIADSSFVNMVKLPEKCVKNRVFLSNLSEQEITGMLYFNRSFARAEMNDMKGAQQDLLLAIRSYPNLPDAHNNIAGLYAQKQQNERALYHYAKAVDLHPGFGPAYIGLAWVELVTGNKEEFVKAYEKALSIDPGLHQDDFDKALREINESKPKGFYQA